ncbi:hypothetical protein [Erysipelothrix aquatica]|uniref:hypothetical protein n=1 Tax=Erysipelothrix aquatica TaxID=2683714 RepID=UPI0013584427|nr:hypothetical protein [Erysipelothrix aquatica]
MKKIKNLTNALSIYIIVYYFFNSMRLDADMRLGQANSMYFNAPVFFKCFIYIGLLQLFVAIALLFYELQYDKHLEEHNNQNKL